MEHSLYTELLQEHVKEGIVDYQGFKGEEAKLDQYLEILENTDPGSLSPNEQFAFYVNAYNACPPLLSVPYQGKDQNRISGL